MARAQCGKRFLKNKRQMYPTISFNNSTESLASEASEGFPYCAQRRKEEMVALLSTYASSLAPSKSALTEVAQGNLKAFVMLVTEDLKVV